MLRFKRLQPLFCFTFLYAYTVYTLCQTTFIVSYNQIVIHVLHYGCLTMYQTSWVRAGQVVNDVGIVILNLFQHPKQGHIIAMLYPPTGGQHDRAGL